MDESTPRFDGLNLVATDLEATVAFYRRLGVTIPDEKIWRGRTGPHHVHTVELGDTALELDSSTLAGIYNAGYRDAPAGGAILGFRLGSRQAVDDLHAQLTAEGYESRQAPYDAFWGARYAIVADPDWRHVGLMSPEDNEHRGTPPDL